MWDWLMDRQTEWENSGAVFSESCCEVSPPALAPMPTLRPTAASTADADRAALHTTASGVPNEHVSRLRQ